MLGEKINKNLESPFEVAKSYYKILFELNGHFLSNLELDLISFTAVRGFITTVKAKKDFVKEYNTSQATVNNLVSKLRRKGILVKEQGKTKVNPAIVKDFSDGVMLVIKLQL